MIATFFLVYLGVSGLFWCIFKVGARYDEWSEQLSTLSLDHRTSPSAEAVIGHPTAEEA